MRLPVTRDLDGVDAAIVGIPFDCGTSFRSGTRFGPRSIRESLLMLWGFNHVMNVAPTEHLKIVDYGDSGVIPVDIRSTMETSSNLQITLFTHSLQNSPVFIRWLPHSVFLRSVVSGFDWCITTGKPVTKNQFGSHSWFSRKEK